MAVAERTQGGDVAEFINEFCRSSKGQFAGEPLEPRPWQREILDGLFELRADGRRRHRTGYVGLPRKNGKSTLCAALALYGLVADQEPGAEVYSCAGDKKQASIVFDEAKRMVQADPDLSELIRVQRYHLEVPSTGSVYRVLSADAALQQGLNPSFVVFDEVHVQPDDELWSVMTLGSGTRRQPLVIGITTAGYDPDSLAFRLYEYGRRVQSGELDDPTFYFRWYEPSRADCDYRDPAVWAEANPAYGDFLNPDDFEAVIKSTPEHQFRRYRLNQWTATAEAWLPFGAWDACRDDGLQLDPSLPLYVGIDMAHRNDSSAVVLAQRQAGRTLVRSRVWENPYPEQDQRHDEWRINKFEVEAFLKELRVKFPRSASAEGGHYRAGPEFAYDPSYFADTAQRLEGDGLAMTECFQHDSLMIPASQMLYQFVVEKRLAHDGDPALARHVGNALAEQKQRGWRLTKPRGSRRKIDAVIACAMAVYRAHVNERPQSVYETRGVLTLG